MARRHRKAFSEMCCQQARAGRINMPDSRFVLMSELRGDNDMVYCYRAGYRLGGPSRPKKEKKSKAAD